LSNRPARHDCGRDDNHDGQHARGATRGSCDGESGDDRRRKEERTGRGRCRERSGCRDRRSDIKLFDDLAEIHRPRSNEDERREVETRAA
jgi:hypothetical protein